MEIIIKKINGQDVSREKYVYLKDLDFISLKDKIQVILPKEIIGLKENDKLEINIK